MKQRSSTPAKKRILIFAHTPPPHHGQSVMVQFLLDGLREDPRFEVFHVDARVSDDLEDVGSFRLQKLLRLIACISRAWWLRLRHGRMAFYYVPAPAKQSAILRDWVVMALCRPLFSRLILHWHSYGLGEWADAANDLQRKVTRLALGKADLSIVLNNYNKRDAEVFKPNRMEIVPNGIRDLFPDYNTHLREKREARAIRLHNLGLRRGSEELETVRFLFLGHLIESKGVFVAIKATALANSRLRKSGAAWRVHLMLAGSFVSEEERTRVLRAIDTGNEAHRDEAPGVSLAGFLDFEKKKSALEKADCLVFPTFYENEAQPLVLLEAMSAGLPIIASSWRGVPEPLPVGCGATCEPRSAAALGDKMVDVLDFKSGDPLRFAFERQYALPVFEKRVCDAISLALDSP